MARGVRTVKRSKIEEKSNLIVQLKRKLEDAKASKSASSTGVGAPKKGGEKKDGEKKDDDGVD